MWRNRPGYEWAIWTAALGLAMAQLWQTRFDVHSDGLSYIEIGEAYAAGEWRQAVNTLWSPLYSWIVGLSLALSSPETQCEAPTVKFVNLVIFVLALASFRRFLVAAYEFHRATSPPEGGAAVEALPRWAFLLFGYALFLRASLQLAPVSLVSPDLLLTAFIYFLFALLLKARVERRPAGDFCRIGLTLGLGYLAKTALLAMAPVFLGVAAFVSNTRRRRWGHALIGLLACLAVAVPSAISLRSVTSYLTFGSAGSWNYSRFVNGIAIPVHWQGEPPAAGRPLHPTRRIFEDPAVYEFAEPIAGVYPPWRDPAHWYAGVSPHYEFEGHVRVMRRGLQVICQSLLNPTYAAVLALWLLAFIGRGWRAMQDLRAAWFIIVPSIAAIGLYLQVYTEPRYVAGYLTALGVAVLSCAHLCDRPITRRLTIGLVMVACLAFCRPALSAVRTAGAVARAALSHRALEADPSWEIARDLQAHGLAAGDRIAYVGSGYRFYWARLAGLRVIAEIRQFDPDGEMTQWAMTPAQARARSGFKPHVMEFWESDTGRKQRVYAVLRGIGVRAVVTDSLPDRASLSDWSRLSTAGYAVYVLDKQR